MEQDLLVRLRSGDPLTSGQQMRLALRLSVPAMLAQVSSIVMQYIDASMVGRLGASDSAAIGLVSSSTWLFGGVCSAAAIGFTVQVAQRIGAGEERRARDIMKQGFAAALALALLLALAGAAISGGLPLWLRGDLEIQAGASAYFLIFALSLPFVQLNTVAGGMLQATGNMRLPSLLHVLMCGLDVVFNLVLIFPGVTILGISIPGAGLGVAGAALGTALAHGVISLTMLFFLLVKSPMLHLRRGESMKLEPEVLRTAVGISLPVAFEQVVMCSAQVLATRIVAPLGKLSVAANSFAVTAEGLCYMPAYGVASAATTLIGQSVGAGRKDLTYRLGWIITGLSMGIMVLSGIFLYAASPWMMALLSPDPEIIALGITVLHIEAFAEPLFGASIVATGVFRGTGDTLIPSCFNFFSMWAIRIPLSAFLAPRIGLRGVWIAMCLELCARGILYLIRLSGRRWLRGEQKG